MNRPLTFIFSLVVCLVATDGFSQWTKTTTQSFQVSLRNTFPELSELSSDAYTNHQAIDGVYYDSFFCKMEVKSLNKLGVMIKIHAGDYDNYALPTRIEGK